MRRPVSVGALADIVGRKTPYKRRVFFVFLMTSAFTPFIRVTEGHRCSCVPMHLVNAIMVLTERFNCEGVRAQSVFRYYGNVTEQKGQNHAYSRSYISILKLNPSQSTKANVE